MAHAIPITAPITESDMRRFWAKVALPDENGCLIWTAGKCGGGYGGFGHGGRSVKAHVFAYTLLMGPVPGGLELDHLCRNRACVAPGHLEAVTPQVNVLRSTGPAALNALKTHCPAGHEYAGANLYVKPDGRRICRTCGRVASRKYNGYGQGSAPSGERTHCPQGHPYSGDNLYVNRAGGRVCRTCGRARSRRHQARKAVSA